MFSAPPVMALPAFEQKADHLLHRHPNLKTPLLAGGEYGIAPVFASSIEYKNGVFTNNNDHFDTASAMHLANEMIWFHDEEVNGFPQF